MKPHYYVIDRRIPFVSRSHPTLEGAQREAEALAFSNPHNSYEIVQVLGISKSVPAQTFWVDGVDPVTERSAPEDP
jgi:hypothetical protein